MAEELDFSLITLNIRGLRDYRKRIKMFNWCLKQELKIQYISYKKHIALKRQKQNAT